MAQITSPMVFKHPDEEFVRWFDPSCWLCQGESADAITNIATEGGIVATAEGVAGGKVGIRFAAGQIGQQGWVFVTFTTTPSPPQTKVMAIPVGVISGKEWIPQGCIDVRLFQWLSQGAVIRHCEQAQVVAQRAIDCLMQINCCPQTPVSVDGETYDFAGYVRALQGLARWAQELCAEEEALEPFYAVSNPLT